MGKLIFKEDLEAVLSNYTATAKQTFPVLDNNSKVPLANLPAEFNAMTTVADIAARDALTNNFDGRNVFVTDASADSTVTSGWAIYKYSTATNPASWVKVAENESLDLVLDWGNIQNIPNTILHTTDVVDNVTSTTTNKPLSGNQGKLLKDAIDTINTTLGATSTLTQQEINAMVAAVFA